MKISLTSIFYCCKEIANWEQSSFQFRKIDFNQTFLAAIQFLALLLCTLTVLGDIAKLDLK